MTDWKWVIATGMAISSLMCGTGFADVLFSPIDPRVPKSIRARLTSAHPTLFKILSVSSKPASELTIADFQSLLDRVGTSADKLTRSFLQRQLDSCREKGADRCAFFEVPRDQPATAFLAEDSRTLWTVRHALQSSITHAKNLQPKQWTAFRKYLSLMIQPVKLRILLLDAKDNVVFDSIAGADSAELTSFVDDEAFSSEKDRDYLTLSNDFAKIRLNRSLNGSPWEFAKQSPAANEEIFVPQFSSVETPVLLSTGKSSVGAEALRLAGLKDLTTDFLRTVDGFVHFADVDAGRAGNGSPWLNKEGQVVGMSARSRVGALDANRSGISPRLERLLNLSKEYNSQEIRAIFGSNPLLPSQPLPLAP